MTQPITPSGSSTSPSGAHSRTGTPTHIPFIKLQARYTGPPRKDEDPATFHPGLNFREWRAAVDNLCAEKNVTQESAKISLARGLIDKIHGRAWNCATRAGNRCHDSTTLEAFYESLLIAVGDDAVESTGDTPYITFLHFMALDFDLDMDVGDYVGLKQRLIKDFFDSLTKKGITTDAEREQR